MTVESSFDLVVIGGGPAGYVASIRAAQLGMKVACIESRGALGGTCLNVGCIPSKALLHSSEIYEQALHGKEHGIVGSIKLDFDAMMKRKEKVVLDLTKGIEGLFAKNKVTYIKGHGIVMAKGEVAVKQASGSPLGIKSKNILIATGSKVSDLAGASIDEEVVVSSTGALSLKKVPENLIVIGGGVIGLELGSVYRRLGSKVTVVEYMDEIIPGQDLEVRKSFKKILEKQGIIFKTSTKVLKVERAKNKASVFIEAKDGSHKETLTADVVLVAVGRKPNTDNLGLKEAGIAVDERGKIKVDSHFQTNIAGIYAIGDVIDGPMLAHKAEEDGVACVETLAGQKGHVNYNLVPSVIYTMPEVASIGKTEEKLKEEGIEYNVGKFPMLANSRARAVGLTDGFVKILADKKTDKVLGVHIISAQAGTMIAEVAVAMEFSASSEDIARTCHSHPDLNEAIKEAALNVDKRAIHI